MKKILFILVIILYIATSCSKDADKVSYQLTYSALHYWQGNHNGGIGCGEALYTFEVCDEDMNVKYKSSNFYHNTTVTGSYTAYTGDWILVIIGVTDVYDYASISVKDQNGKLVVYTSTDNLYITNSDDHTLEKSANDNKIQLKIQLK